MYHLSEDECQVLRSCARVARVINRTERTSSHQRLLELGLINEVTIDIQDISSTDGERKLLRGRALISLTDVGRKELDQRIREATSS